MRVKSREKRGRRERNEGRETEGGRWRAGWKERVWGIWECDGNESKDVQLQRREHTHTHACTHARAHAGDTLHSLKQNESELHLCVSVGDMMPGQLLSKLTSEAENKHRLTPREEVGRDERKRPVT